MLDFRNVNSLWSSVLVETLARIGLNTAVICPGSRSTPLTIAFANHAEIDTIPILDERSAAFFALGRAKKSQLPVALVCTSGTAGANFYPAVIEATETGIPLIILTADRPPELRNCHAGQTIDQVKLYGDYPNWYVELALPEANLALLQYLRQNIIQAWQRSQYPVKGVVHLNLPFREPLAPLPQPEVMEWKTNFPLSEFFQHLAYLQNSQNESYLDISSYISQWQSCNKGIIIAGLAQPDNPQLYGEAVAQLSKKLNFPVLAEALSPLRNYRHLNPYLISTYDLILRNPTISSQLVPEVIIQIGELPTSKQLRSWLKDCNCDRYIINSKADNFDPLHGKTIHLKTNIQQLIQQHQIVLDSIEIKDSSYLHQWCNLEIQGRKKIDFILESTENLFEGKIAWLLSQNLPPQTSLFLANSMSIRNAEFFWQPNNTKIRTYFNRGANGIDGTLSSAVGIAYKDNKTVLLTGDLALLHDTNGFLINHKFAGHLTIIVVNNNGGGIFEMLPIVEFDPPFEEYFATPQEVNFQQLCLSYRVEYELINNWQQLIKKLNPLPKQGIRLLEIPTNRKLDKQWFKKYLSQIALELTLN